MNIIVLGKAHERSSNLYKEVANCYTVIQEQEIAAGIYKISQFVTSQTPTIAICFYQNAQDIKILKDAASTLGPHLQQGILKIVILGPKLDESDYSLFRNFKFSDILIDTIGIKEMKFKIGILIKVIKGKENTKQPNPNQLMETAFNQWTIPLDSVEKIDGILQFKVKDIGAKGVWEKITSFDKKPQWKFVTSTGDQVNWIFAGEKPELRNGQWEFKGDNPSLKLLSKDGTVSVKAGMSQDTFFVKDKIEHTELTATSPVEKNVTKAKLDLSGEPKDSKSKKSDPLRSAPGKDYKHPVQEINSKELTSGPTQVPQGSPLSYTEQDPTSAPQNNSSLSQNTNETKSKNFYIISNPALMGMVGIGETDEDPKAMVEKLNESSKSGSKYQVDFTKEMNHKDYDIDKMLALLDAKGKRVSKGKNLFRASVQEVIHELNAMTGDVPKEQFDLGEEDTETDESKDFKKVVVQEYLDFLDCSLCNVYIHMPINKRYSVFIPSGFEYDDERKEKIKSHSNQNFFVAKDDFDKLILDIPALPDKNADISPELIDNLHRYLCHKNFENSEALVLTIKEVSEKIIKTVYPTDQFIKQLLSTDFINMNLVPDVLAISAISLFIAKTLDITDPRNSTDVVSACLLMDISLSHVNKNLMDQYYNKTYLNNEKLVKKFHDHPLRSYAVVERIANIESSIANLVKYHHERTDGSGYPLKLLGTNINEMGRIICLAVDIFEEIYYQRYLQKISMGIIGEFKKERQVSIPLVIARFSKEILTGKSQRHSKLIISKVITYIKDKNLISAKELAYF